MKDAATTDDRVRTLSRTFLRISRLKRLPGFSRLSAADLTHLTSWMAWHRIRKDRQFKPKAAANDFFMIIEGELQILAMDRDGNPLTIMLLKPGQFFGELSQIFTNENQFRAIGLSDGLTARIPQNHFAKVLQMHPDVAMAAYANLCGVVRTLGNCLRCIAGDESRFTPARRRDADPRRRPRGQLHGRTDSCL